MNYLSKENATTRAILLHRLFGFTDWAHNFINIFPVQCMVLFFIMTESAGVDFVTARCLNEDKKMLELLEINNNNSPTD